MREEDHAERRTRAPAQRSGATREAAGIRSARGHGLGTRTRGNLPEEPRRVASDRLCLTTSGKETRRERYNRPRARPIHYGSGRGVYRIAPTWAWCTFTPPNVTCGQTGPRSAGHITCQHSRRGFAQAVAGTAVHPEGYGCNFRALEEGCRTAATARRAFRREVLPLLLRQRLR